MIFVEATAEDPPPALDPLYTVLLALSPLELVLGMIPVAMFDALGKLLEREVIVAVVGLPVLGSVLN